MPTSQKTQSKWLGMLRFSVAPLAFYKPGYQQQKQSVTDSSHPLPPGTSSRRQFKYKSQVSLRPVQGTIYQVEGPKQDARAQGKGQMGSDGDCGWQEMLPGGQA